MKRTAFFLVAALSIPAFQIISNCSQPLESSDLDRAPGPGAQGRVDTLYVLDTTYIVHDGNVDTVIVVDTIIQVDTVTVTDTITEIDTVFSDTTIIDTVIVVEPGDIQMICDRLSCKQKEIVWLFRNAEGYYHLEFAAASEKEQPTHTLTVSIDGQAYDWKLSESLELVLDQNLGANATIRITTSTPKSFGHAIDVCLTMTKM